METILSHIFNDNVFQILILYIVEFRLYCILQKLYITCILNPTNCLQRDLVV